MAKYCPITETRVVYLDCQECEEKECLKMTNDQAKPFKPNKMLLIDGSSMLSAGFYATVPREYMFAKTQEDKEKALENILRTSRGEAINGVYAMMRMLEDTIRRNNPTHVAIAWDLTRDTFRRKLYSEYKSTRSATPEPLKEQFILAQKMLKHIGYAQFGDKEYEADDFIGSLACRFSTEMPVYIWSKDQDILQVLDDNVFVWLNTKKAEDKYKELGVEDIKSFNLPKNIFEYSVETFRHFYGVEPMQLIDRKALEGDKSDNIPGIKGMGEKSVVPLLQEFETVEGIYDFLKESDEAEQKEMFKSLGIRNPAKKMLETSEEILVGEAAAMLSKQLATIKTDLPMIQELKCEKLQYSINEEKRESVFKHFEFESLIRK